MEYKEVMTALKNYGTAQNRKIYKRHGVKGELFGVSFGNLNILKKKIKKNQPLAEKLWASKNMDAQTLATMVADPDTVSAKTVDSWVKDINYYLLSDLFGAFVAKTKHADSRIKKWTKSKNEFMKQTGYALIACKLRDNAEISDQLLKSFLKTIEQEIHNSPNRARHSMYMTLIAIGIYRPTLKEIVYKAAEKIGKVEVDHGETSCKTPDAIPYIEKAYKRNKKKK